MSVCAANLPRPLSEIISSVDLESESGRQRSRRFCVAVQVLIAIYVVFMVVVVLAITLLPADWRL